MNHFDAASLHLSLRSNIVWKNLRCYVVKRCDLKSGLLSTLFLCLGVACQTFSVSALPAVNSHKKMYTLYQTVSKLFWGAEHQLQQRGDRFASWNPAYQSPLAKDDPLYQKYFQVDQAANEYITFLDASKSQSWTLPPVLYLGGIAAFTIGDYANAQKYFSRLLKNHSDYKRYFYVGDNYAPDPDFAQPVKPGVTKLLFYCQIVGSGGGAPASDAFAGFQQFNQTSLKVLSTQTEFASWLLHRNNKFQRRVFLNEDYGNDEPDQLRASALPKTSQLIEDGWKELFPAALKKSGALKMREYLRHLLSVIIRGHIAARYNYAAPGRS